MYAHTIIRIIRIVNAENPYNTEIVGTHSLEVYNLDKTHNSEKEISERIFTLLKEQKVTQKEFAGMLGLSPQAISDWKKGINTSFTKYLNIISEVLHTTPRWLFSGDGIKYLPEEQRHEILNQSKSEASARLIRTALHYTIDQIPSENLDSQMLPLVELFEKMNTEDLILTQAIIEILIARRKRALDAGADSTDNQK